MQNFLLNMSDIQNQNTFHSYLSPKTKKFHTHRHNSSTAKPITPILSQPTRKNLSSIPIAKPSFFTNDRSNHWQVKKLHGAKWVDDRGPVFSHRLPAFGHVYYRCTGACRGCDPKPLFPSWPVIVYNIWVMWHFRGSDRWREKAHAIVGREDGGLWEGEEDLVFFFGNVCWFDCEVFLNNFVVFEIVVVTVFYEAWRYR